jgi:hypothetical protein
VQLGLLFDISVKLGLTNAGDIREQDAHRDTEYKREEVTENWKNYITRSFMICNRQHIIIIRVIK